MRQRNIIEVAAMIQKLWAVWADGDDVIFDRIVSVYKYAER